MVSDDGPVTSRERRDGPGAAGVVDPKVGADDGVADDAPKLNVGV